MRIFDFNIHLPRNTARTGNGGDTDERHLKAADLTQSLRSHLPALNQVAAANFMLFNTTLFDRAAEFETFSAFAEQHFSPAVFTALVDFRKPNVAAYLERARAAGVQGIKFHSYIQRIAPADFPHVLETCRVAEAEGFFICIDTSYGTSNMYTHDNLRLACSVADHITEAPIILLHSGGARVLEAMLLADEKKNVYLETSFSIAYYQRASIYGDFAFAYKKIGTNRVLYASDHPYIDAQESADLTVRYLEAHDFAADQIEAIMHHNAMRLLGHG